VRQSHASARRSSDWTRRARSIADSSSAILALASIRNRCEYGRPANSSRISRSEKPDPRAKRITFRRSMISSV